MTLVKNLKKFTLFLLFITLIGIAVYATWRSFQHPTESMPQFATAVDAVAAKTEMWTPQINTTGTLNAMQGITVKAETSGRITNLYFSSGQYIKSGEPLLQIYSDTLKAELAANEAKAVLSRVEYQRQATLEKQHVGTRSELDKARAQMVADEANIERVKAILKQTLIPAPFDGKLGLQLVEIGDYVNPGDPIVNLQALDPMRVDFSIPEVYLRDLAVGQTVTIRTRSYPDATFTGKVYAFESTLNPRSRSLAVRAEIPNANHKLLPGLFVQVDVETATPKPTITIPLTALMYDEEGNYVYKIVKGHAIKTIVSTGIQKNDAIEILSGVKAGDRVIVAGQLKITSGAEVTERNKKP